MASSSPSESRSGHGDADHCLTRERKSRRGSQGTFPPFDSSTFGSQLVWLALAFGALYLLMSRSRFRASHPSWQIGMIAWRADLDQGRQLKAETDDAIDAYEKALADARGNAQAIAGETNARLAAETDAKRKALEAELSGEAGCGRGADHRVARPPPCQNVRGIAVDTTSAIIERLMGPAASAAKSTRLYRESDLKPPQDDR